MSEPADDRGDIRDDIRYKHEYWNRYARPSHDVVVTLTVLKSSLFVCAGETSCPA
jgi:hypothetical protein